MQSYVCRQWEQHIGTLDASDWGLLDVVAWCL